MYFWIETDSHDIRYLIGPNDQMIAVLGSGVSGEQVEWLMAALTRGLESRKWPEEA